MKKDISRWDRWQNLIIIIYFLMMTIIYTRPLSSHIVTHTVGHSGDNLYFIWMIEWIKRAIFEIRTMPLVSNLLNYPYGYNLLITEIAPLQILIALPFAVIGNPVLGYNISMMSTFFLAGIFMYWWVFAITKSRIAGMVSGTAFAFLPYHVAHFLTGHLNISGIQWFPLYFWSFSEILINKKFSWKPILLLSAGLSGIFLTSLYYTYMTFIISAAVLFFYYCFLGTWKHFNRTIIKQFVYAGMVSFPSFFVGVAPFIYYHYLRGSARHIQDAMTYSASVNDYFLPFTKQLLFGKWVSESFSRDFWEEATLYLGIPILILSIIGWINRKKMNQSNLFRIFLIGGVTAGMLSMGTNLKWMEQSIWINLPEWAAELTGQSRSLIYLPGFLFYKYLPFYSIMRVSMRYAVFVMVFVCAAAGMGFSWLKNRLNDKWKPIFGLAILGIVALDFFNTPFSMIKISPREVDQWLADQPYGGLVQLPFNESLDQEHFYYTLYNNKSLLGAVAAFPSDRFLDLNQSLSTFPDAASISALRNEKITYVIIDEKEIAITEALIKTASENGLTYQGSFSGQSVFILNY